jgi:hypothetical protein
MVMISQPLVGHALISAKIFFPSSVTVKSTTVQHYIGLGLTLVGAMGLSIESFLSLSERSLCSTKACQAVGKYLVVSESFLVAAGALSLWLLAAVLFFAGRYPERLKNLLFPVFALALALDSSLIGFQFFIIRQTCLLCLSVAVLLALITLFYCLSKRAYLLLSSFVLLWLGSFGIHAIMIMPPPQRAYAGMIVFQTRASLPPASAKSHQPQLTLVMSMNCPHCIEVVEYLSQHPQIDANIKIAAIDQDALSLTKLTHFIEQAPASKNPFQLLKELKETPDITPVLIPEMLKNQAKNGSYFLNNLGIQNIPALFVDIAENEKRVLIGTPAILSFLSQFPSQQTPQN